MDRFQHPIDHRRDLAAQLASDPLTASRNLWPELRLRPYQEDPVAAVAQAVALRAGGLYVWTFSRQSGKDEALAQLVAWIGLRYSLRGGSIIVAAPTEEPQARQMQDRLIARLMANRLTARLTRTRGSTVWIGKVAVKFLSAAEEANQRGETASLLLVGNEAQDIDPAIWNARMAPMTASTNAPTLIMGTVWDTEGMLHHAMETLERTHPERLFRVPWDDVAPFSAAYAAHCRQQLDRLGPDHPYWQTEYELRPLSAQGGLFPRTRTAQLEGTHEQLSSGIEGERYALLIDVAGEEETDNTAEAYDTGAKRDSTTCLIVRCIDTGRQPRFEVVHRLGWTGISHVRLLDQLEHLAVEVWRADFVVIDATGIGAGLASFMEARFARRRVTVVRHVWTLASKSDAGFALVSMMDTGRIKDYRIADDDHASRTLYEQLHQVRYSVLEGTKRIRWSVPAHLGHDDEVMALALLPALDEVYTPKRIARAA